MPPPSTSSAKSKDQLGKVRGKADARKNKPKKSVSEPERIRRLFSSLCSQIDGGHFANAIKTCDKILRIYPDDVDALNTKLFLLLQTDQCEPALAVIEGEKDKSKVAFEHAYALYRSHEDVKAKNAIKPLREQNADDRGLAHLEAQLFYRTGLYQEAYDLYNELLDSTDPDTDEHSDILTNLRAAQKHLDFITNDYLRSIDTLPASFANSIETAPPPAPPPSILAARSVTTQQQPSTASPQKTRTVRKSRVPPGVIPGVTPPPDPERWLKKSERSTYSQGRKRRGGGGATQGSAALDAPAVGNAAASKAGKGKRKK